MKYAAALFDLDGTLLNTLADLTDSMNVALCSLGCPPRTADECRFFVGDGTRNYALRSLPEDRRDDATVGRCVELMRAHYQDHWADKTRPYEGIPEMLAELAAAGLRLAVLSNKPDDFTTATVRHFFDDGTFEIVRGALPAVPLKPHPAGAKAIASQLDISPEQFLYLGDTNTDMQTARAAGMFAVGALWGFRPAEELAAHGAQKLIEHPREILKLL